MAFFLSTGSPQPPPYLHSTRWTRPLLGIQQGPPVSAQRHGAPSRRPSRPPAASPAMFPWRLAQSLSGAEIDLPRSMFCPIPGCPLTPMEISTHHPLKSPRKWEPWRPMPPLIATAQQQRVGPPSLGFTHCILPISTSLLTLASRLLVKRDGRPFNFALPAALPGLLEVLAASPSRILVTHFRAFV